MKVVKLFVKPQHGSMGQECQILNVRRGYGILGDINALPGNPRQVLIISASNLTKFNLSAGDLRENILIDASVENFSSGMILQVGSSALIRLTFLCEPCNYLDKLQFGLAKKIKGKRGFLGMIVRDGALFSGDRVTVTSHRLQALSNEPKGRFAEFVERIPLGKVVKTPDLLMAMGVSKAYFRAIPTFLKKADPQLPIHRIVRADGGLLSEYIAAQQQWLVEEGVEVKQEQLANERTYWESSQFHELGNF